MQAHNVSIKVARSGSLLSMGGVGRWIDKGITKLMGSPSDTPVNDAASSRAGSDTEGAGRHRRNRSDMSDASSVWVSVLSLVTTRVA